MLLILTLLTACVSQADYDAVVAENAKMSARLEKIDARMEKQMQDVRDLQADLKPLIDRGLLRVEMIDGRLTLQLASDILFEKGSADLSTDGKSAIGELARALSRRAGDRDFQVEGHTDSDPINTPQFPNNWYLGAARGITVAEHMVSQGFPRIHISAATYADTQPAASNGTNGGQAQNRRIEIVLVPDVGDIPGYRKLTNEGPKKGKKKKS